MKIKAYARGVPKAQPRPRARRAGKHVHVYNPSSANEWKKTVKLAFSKYKGICLEDPIKITIRYYLKRPKSLMRKKDPANIIFHTRKPDIDNLNKAVMDSLTNIGIWKDDSQVCIIQASKHFSDKEEKLLGAIIIIEEV